MLLRYSIIFDMGEVGTDHQVGSYFTAVYDYSHGPNVAKHATPLVSYFKAIIALQHGHSLLKLYLPNGEHC